VGGVGGVGGVGRGGREGVGEARLSATAHVSLGPVVTRCRGIFPRNRALSRIWQSRSIRLSLSNSGPATRQ
jgi:hypothetical protein